MQNILISDVKEIIQENKQYIPKGYILWENQTPWESESLTELLGFLYNLFKEEERAIKNERSTRHINDNYENGVRNFAIALVKKLVKYHEILNGIQSYAKLLGQKHMAYAFYHLCDINLIESLFMLKEIRYEKPLYQGLTEFYRTFYGSFADNEEAICLLCKYYPKNDDSWLEQEDVISALIDHLKNAGTPNDLGYAYQGIGLIQQYIHELPNNLILELLKKYGLYEILNQKIYRHQIFAIIDGSGLTKTDKHLWKFFYLDSLLLANHFNYVWVDKATELGDRIETYYNSYDEKLDRKQIQVLKNPNAYWDNQEKEKRVFWETGQQMAHVVLQDGTISFVVQGKNSDFPFVYNDWELEDFRSKETREKIRRLVSDKGGEHPEGKRMMFSLLYLDNYRGMQRQLLDFDHKYIFDPDSRKLNRQKTERIPGFHFYGKAVYSLSCIVGKNGTGKTSSVNFLRDVFYKMIKLLEDSEDQCKRGCVITDIFIKNKLLSGNESYLIVFRIGEDDYFLTNIADFSTGEVLPYQKGICRNLDFCKVAYFSQQMLADQMIRFENGERTERQNVSGISRALEGLGQCDYSEMKSYLQKKNALTTFQRTKTANETELVINKELCYQFSLLRNIGIEKLYEYLDILQKGRLVIYSLETGDILEDISSIDYQNTSETKELEQKYAKMPNAEIGFVSSGQYAKFMFLAKLHWFLNGYHKDIEYYRDIFGRTAFSREEALQEEEAALIFIDEGELYYHPEWQRRYLSTLLEMLCLCKEEAKLQIVFTTNSPFVISDVLKEDVQYLSDKKEKFDDTLGQNIHKLLIKNFFMEYTIGEYSRKLIETIIKWLRYKNKENSEEDSKEWMDIFTYIDNTEDHLGLCETIRFLIQQIGEPIYREKLKKMLEERMADSKTSDEIRIHELEKKKAALEQELAQLKEKKNDKN